MAHTFPTVTTSWHTLYLPHGTLYLPHGIHCNYLMAYSVPTSWHTLYQLQGIKKYGILGTELNWFKSYLTLKNCQALYLKSSLVCLNGPYWAPYSFCSYINDLPLSSTFLTLLYAGDTTLLMSIF